MLKQTRALNNPENTIHTIEYTLKTEHSTSGLTGYERLHKITPSTPYLLVAT